MLDCLTKPGFFFIKEEAEEKQGPDSHMYHHVGGIKDIVPVRDVLNVDKVDDAAVNQAIDNIAATSPYNETETDKFIALHRIAEPQVSRDRNHQSYTDQSK